MFQFILGRDRYLYLFIFDIPKKAILHFYKWKKAIYKPKFSPFMMKKSLLVIILCAFNLFKGEKKFLVFITAHNELKHVQISKNLSVTTFPQTAIFPDFRALW